MPNMIPLGLSVLALLLVFAGLGFSGNSRRPGLFRIGAIVAALGLMLLWVLPVWLFSADRGLWAMPMFIGVLVVAVSVLGAGLQLMARACGAREESAADRLFDDFVRHNELP
jgi:Na+-transporting NADH:ubiquinone oxidoreductase subunit NqrB